MRKYGPFSTLSHIRGLKKLLKYFESQSEISRVLDISKQNVNGWFTGRTVIPLEQARRLSNMVQGRIKLEELRPDLKKDKKVLAIRK